MGLWVDMGLNSILRLVAQKYTIFQLGSPGAYRRILRAFPESSGLGNIVSPIARLWDQKPGYPQTSFTA